MKRFKHILFVFDDLPGDELALDVARKLARDNRARLSAVSVLEKPMPIYSKFSEVVNYATLCGWLESDRLETMKSFLRNASRHLADLETGVTSGVYHVEIIRSILKWNCDLVIKRRSPRASQERKKDWSHNLQLLRHCPVPLFLVHQERPTIQRVLVPLDLHHHELDAKILELGHSLAQKHKAELHLIHVWKTLGIQIWDRLHHLHPQENFPDLEERLQADLRQQLKLNLARLGLEETGTQMHLIKGSVSSDIPRVAHEQGIDAVVMGTLARTGVAGLVMGNTAETVVNQLECSLLTVKPPGFRSPITDEQIVDEM